MSPSAGIDGVPLLVFLHGARVVCVGAGPVAASKVPPLIDAGADVHLVSPDAAPALAEAAAAGRCRWHRRSYSAGDLAGALLVVAATSSAEVNARVAADAAALPALCVRVDAGARSESSPGTAGEAGDADLAGDGGESRATGGAPPSPAAGSAAFLSTVRRGPLLLSVSTSGQAPALARYLRTDLESTYDDAWGACASLLGQLRRDPAVRAVLAGLPAAERRRRWRSLPVLDIVDLLRNDSVSDAKELATACLSSSSD